MSQIVIWFQSLGANSVNWTSIFIILGSLLILLILVYFGVGAFIASRLSLPRRVFDPSNNPEIFGLLYEEIRFPARNDGLGIAAWYIPSDKNERAIVLVHGRDDCRTSAFGGEFVSFANVLHQAGFSVLMIDLRGHGQSDVARYTFGIKERLDVLGAVDWLEARGFKSGSIGVLGYSLGAGSVIGAASEDESIGAIWLDSAYTDVRSILEQNWRTETGLPLFLLDSARVMTRLMYGYDVHASRPLDEIVKIVPRPIYLAHCQHDPMIPVAHSQRLYAAVPDAQIWVMENCDQHTIGKEVVPEKYNCHAIGYVVQPEEYGRRVIEFFKKTLR